MIHITGGALPTLEKSAVTLGNFDGLHLGHQELVSALRLYSKQHNLSSVVFSFFPHPAVVLKDKNFKTILSSREKKTLLEQMDIDFFVEYPFDDNFASVDPAFFLKNILAEQLNCKAIIIGEGFRFGANRTGTEEMMRISGAQHGIKVISVPNLEHAISDKTQGVKISSGNIRQLINEKRLASAEALMGRPYFLSASTTAGINLSHMKDFNIIEFKPDPEKLIPPDGIYITRINCNGQLYPGITDIIENKAVCYINDSGIGIEDAEPQIFFYEWLRETSNAAGQAPDMLRADMDHAVKYLQRI